MDARWKKIDEESVGWNETDGHGTVEEDKFAE